MTLSYWQGEAGDAYLRRNFDSHAEMLPRIDLWRQISKHLQPAPGSVFEVGANFGRNLRAFNWERSDAPTTFALEPNDLACALLESRWPHPKIIKGRAQAIKADDGFADLTFTSGVLIHIPPDELLQACKEIHRCSREWIVAIEYFSAEPRMVPYRGENDRLWTRDFGAFYLDNFPDLKPVACGFAWKRMTGLDDLTWWVLRKENKPEFSLPRDNSEPALTGEILCPL